MTALADRSAVLVTGMSGSGKSTALAELGRRGHRVVDTDDPGWIVNFEAPLGIEPMWDLDRVRTLLDAHGAGWLFVAGCVANQGALYDRFDAVVVLSAPLDVILARVAERANPFGSRPEDRARIAEDLAAIEPLLRARADHEIATTAPVGRSLRRLSSWPPQRPGAPIVPDSRSACDKVKGGSGHARGGSDGHRDPDEARQRRYRSSAGGDASVAFGTSPIRLTMNRLWPSRS